MADGTKYVYDFSEGNTTMKTLLGGKGANLAEMTGLGLPVPPGFTITTEACNYYSAKREYPKGLNKEIDAHLAALEKQMGKKLGDDKDPLLVSVRSGAALSMPGMMDTVLNLGLNDRSVQGLIKRTGNPRFAYDAYRRFIQMFSGIVMEIDREHFEEALTAMKQARKVKQDIDLKAADWQELVKQFKAIVRKQSGREFPTKPREQLDLAIKAVFQLLDEPPRHRLPQDQQHPHEPGHRRQRADHGLRQHGQELRHRGVLHPRPQHRREPQVRRVPHQRPGRGRGGGHPHPQGPDRDAQGASQAAQGAHRHHEQAGEALPRHAGHRVHHGEGQAVHAADPHRQALRRAPP